MYMSQLNINMTPEFEELLRKYMEKNNIRYKSEAIRRALKQAVEETEGSKEKTLTFRDLIGRGLKGKLNPNPRFRTHDDIWNKK